MLNTILYLCHEFTTGHAITRSCSTDSFLAQGTFTFYYTMVHNKTDVRLILGSQATLTNGA